MAISLIPVLPLRHPTNDPNTLAISNVEPGQPYIGGDGSQWKYAGGGVWVRTDTTVATGVYRGAWNSATAYVTGDEVSSGGFLWIANRNNTNVAPVEGLDWSKISTQGAQGPQGIQGIQGIQGVAGTPGSSGVLRGIDEAATLGIPVDGIADSVAALITHFATFGANYSRPLALSSARVGAVTTPDILRIATTWELQRKWKLIAEPPGQIKIETGITLYIAGALIADRYPVFQFVGTGKVKLHQTAHGAMVTTRGTYSPDVYGEWFGALMDGTNDDAPGWEKWIDALITPYQGGTPLTGRAASLGPNKIPGGAVSVVNKPIRLVALTGHGIYGEGQYSSYIHMAHTPVLRQVVDVSGSIWTLSSAPEADVSTGRMVLIVTNGAPGLWLRITGAATGNSVPVDQSLATIGLTARGAYNAATAYVLNDVVTSGGFAWKALRAVTGVTPVEGADWSRLEAMIMWRETLALSGCHNTTLRDFSLKSSGGSFSMVGLYYYRSDLESVSGSTQVDLHNVTEESCGVRAGMAFGGFFAGELIYQADLVTIVGARVRGGWWDGLTTAEKAWKWLVGLWFGPAGPPSNAVNFAAFGIVVVARKYGVYISNTNVNIVGQTIQTCAVDIFVNGSTVASSVRAIRNEDSRMILEGRTTYAKFPSSFELTEELARGNGLERVPGTGRCRMAYWEHAGLCRVEIQLTELRMIAGGPTSAITAFGADWFEGTLAGIVANEFGPGGTKSGAQVTISSAGDFPVKAVAYVASNTATGGAPAPAGKVRVTVERAWAAYPDNAGYVPIVGDVFQIDAVPMFETTKPETTVDMTGCHLPGGPERVIEGPASWIAHSYRRVNSESEIWEGGGANWKESYNIGSRFVRRDHGNVSGTLNLTHRSSERHIATADAALAVNLAAADWALGDDFFFELKQGGVGGFAITWVTDAAHPLVWEGNPPVLPPASWAANITMVFHFYWDGAKIRATFGDTWT